MANRVNVRATLLATALLTQVRIQGGGGMSQPSWMPTFVGKAGEVVFRFVIPESSAELVRDPDEAGAS